MTEQHEIAEIVQRLREKRIGINCQFPDEDCREGAAALERLNAENAILLESELHWKNEHAVVLAGLVERDEDLRSCTESWHIAKRNQFDAEARLAESEKTIGTLESNARIQATLLADTGRERDGLRARLGEAVKIVQFAHDGYENHNVNHVDYRVRVYQACLDFLNPDNVDVGGSRTP